MNNDESLTLAEKYELVLGIEHWQEKRWERLRFWHNADGLNRKNRHLFMQREIDLIREQKARLTRLKQSLNN